MSRLICVLTTAESMEKIRSVNIVNARRLSRRLFLLRRWYTLFVVAHIVCGLFALVHCFVVCVVVPFLV